MTAWWLPLAETTPAAEMVGATTYEWSRLPVYSDERWQYGVLAAVVVALLSYVVWLYRRDGAGLRAVVAGTLLVLRLIALAGLLVFFLGLQKRTEQRLVHNSRVLLLVDTSQSMGMHDSDSSPVPADPSRVDQVAAEFANGAFLKSLSQVHDVDVIRFDRDSTRVASIRKLVSQASPEGADQSDPPSEAALDVDWNEMLLPQGVETRLGSALKRLIDQEGTTPVSAIVVFSDGAQNAGIAPAAAAAAAREAKIPIYTVGLGSNRTVRNVRIADFVAPARAYPEDSFTVTGYIQSQGFADRTVTVELYARETSDNVSEGVLEESRRLSLGSDGEVTPVEFQVAAHVAGRRTYRLQIDAIPGDQNATDNRYEVDVDVVDRKSRVLLLAGGPTREYRFLRNQLRRDDDVVLDVFLQSARPGISQDADQVLDDFPITKEELYQYDAVVAFDPDWDTLSEAQIDLLENWVAEEAGGLIVIAGPVYTDQLTRNRRLAKIRNLYPVEFFRRFSLLSDSQYGSVEPWPLEFTQAGLEAEFLAIDDSLVTSRAAWAGFEGVFGHYAVKGAKPGATVYARFADPEARIGGEFPVYMAGHFYGSGRVFYLGSGEIWRLRAIDEAHFEKFYTKLVRHVSQGRLLRGSARGVLLVERDRYRLGDTVVVRAQLSSDRFEPLDVAMVTLQVTNPDSTGTAVPMAQQGSRKGMYVGQFTALQEGTFRLDLPLSDAIGEQLSQRIHVRVPDLERVDPRRNDALLSEIATATGATYYVGLESLLGHETLPPLTSVLRDRSEITTLRGAPDREFEKQLSQWLLGIICGALCCEWLIRRLSRLA